MTRLSSSSASAGTARGGPAAGARGRRAWSARRRRRGRGRASPRLVAQAALGFVLGLALDFFVLAAAIFLVALARFGGLALVFSRASRSARRLLRPRPAGALPPRAPALRRAPWRGRRARPRSACAAPRRGRAALAAGLAAGAAAEPALASARRGGAAARWRGGLAARGLPAWPGSPGRRGASSSRPRPPCVGRARSSGGRCPCSTCALQGQASWTATLQRLVAGILGVSHSARSCRGSGRSVRDRPRVFQFVMSAG